MEIIVKNGTPKNMEKALREAFDLVGAQLNENADKYGVTVSAIAYPDNGDKFGKKLYITATNRKLLASCFLYLTGEFADDKQTTDLITMKG